MENPFSLKDKGTGYWTSPRAQTDGMAPSDGGARNSISEDPFNHFSEIMNFDTYAGWCNSPSATDQMFASYGLSSLQSTPYASFDLLSFAEQNSPTSLLGSVLNAAGTSYNSGDKMAFQQADSQFSYASDLMDADDLGAKQSNGSQQQSDFLDMDNCMISRPIGFSLDEKMLRALSLLKESAGDGILAQVWVPMRHRDQYIMTTFEQPYLLDQILAGYREVSRTYTFSAEVKPDLPLGLPGRVFISKVPEWTSNVVYYRNTEYLRAKHARHHKVQGSIALPIFEPPEMSCCAVLELVTIRRNLILIQKWKMFASPPVGGEAVNLRTTAPPRLLPQSLSGNQRAALTEITDVLRAVCHAHSLPLALTWIPCNYMEEAVDEIIKVRVREEHYIEEGQGIAGKALQSNHPFFFPDVKAYDIIEYPLVHHARKYGLNAAVAIRLRSTYTGDDDYILEFFLPVNMKGSSEQQLLLNNLSAGSKYDGMESDGPHEQVMNRSRRQLEKKRSTAEKNVSLSVLQQYFSGSLKDAAKSIGGSIVQEKSFLFPDKKLPSRNSESATEDAVSVPAAHIDGNNSSVKVEEDECCVDACGELLIKSSACVIDCSEDSKLISTDAGIFKRCIKLTKLEEEKHSKVKCDDHGSKITVKATYKEDTIRFKFEPSAGCFQLYEEIAKRFKLQNGTFQLKYLDDEEEWVMLLGQQQLLLRRKLVALQFLESIAFHISSCGSLARIICLRFMMYSLLMILLKERACGPSGSTPFKPPSSGSTIYLVEASGTAKPGEIVPSLHRNASVNRNALGRPAPPSPWQHNYGTSNYGVLTITLAMVWVCMFHMHGGLGGMYGGGMYGKGMYGGECMMQGVVNCFGCISILIVQNAQALHMIMSALLQLFDRSGLLYVELARFALRLLGFRTKPRKVQPRAPNGLPPPPENQQHLQGSKAAPSGPGTVCKKMMQYCFRCL
ncbi:hypothetical protein GH714_005193 [Hevea brasiliensis]|uniref:PB1 domain-containing protein n=1 Tax=Hevea brasiliensis TaxID=3981 RepID=A0A6A6NAV1_HEVBR|nr:hypothetical protein GH714_005193 [Hevea brasiliensis]